ncbi:MAG TPA: Holliday junction resolvase RuvX [Humisphaera sp.]|jgi:putative Holliday junction resolvase|nr:Holliday junction resolvase RuvX [Humisphaera sp.]
MRTLAIDLGTRRVGLALSDEGGRFATPLDVIEVSSPEHAVNQIIPVIKREGVQRLVVGVPLNMDGTIGPAARDAAKWGRELSTRCNIPLVLLDERLSSFDAEQQLIERKRGGEKITRQAKKRRLDAIAAAGFLQAFLDGKIQPLTGL